MKLLHKLIIYVVLECKNTMATEKKKGKIKLANATSHPHSILTSFLQ